MCEKVSLYVRAEWIAYGCVKEVLCMCEERGTKLRAISDLCLIGLPS